MNVSFEIRVADALAPEWASRFADWTVLPHPAGGTALRGVFLDQTAVFDALQLVRDLRLTLVSVVPRVESRTPITAQEKTVEQLDADAHVWSIFEAVSDGLAIRDQNGVIVEVNPAYCELYGYTREELIGTITDPPLTPEHQRIFDAYLATVNGGGTFGTSGWQFHHSGERIHIEMRAVPFNYAGVPHILDLARNTSEQMRAYELAEQRADARTRELATLLEVSRQVTSTLDLGPLLRVALTQLHTVLPYAAATVNLCDGPDRLALMVYKGPIPQTSLPKGWSIGPARPPRTPLVDLIAEAEAGLCDPQAFGREVIYSGEPVIIPDVAADTPLARAFRARLGTLLRGIVPEYIGSWMGVPLVYRDQVIGMLDFDHEQPGAFTERHARVALVAASQVTIAIANARLLAEVQGHAAQEERQRLARELHDAVTQQLFSASLIGEVLPQIWAANPVKGAEYLEDLRLLTKGALAEMRALLVELRPAALTTTPLPELLQHLTAALGGRARIQTELHVAGEGGLPDDVQVALYRVTQEALNNIVKHAQARHVQVTLQLMPDAATVEVRDDGRGFDPAAVPPDHFGLAIMRERMAAVGGTVAVVSQPGHGSTLTARWHQHSARGSTT